VVHGKGSLLNKMPGDEWLKCANLRAYLGFMWTHPGKKLLFMGSEIGQWTEWNHDRTVEWHLLDNPRHRGLQRMVRDLNRLYVTEPGLHTSDTEPGGFEWVVGDDAANSVFAFLRKPLGDGRPLLVVCNMTPVPRHHYRIGVPHGGHWREVLNSDAEIYGGSNMGNGGGRDAEGVGSHGQDHSLSLTLPPLSTIVLRPA
jgi:1,4-alpha-glucan branching enzyme